MGGPRGERRKEELNRSDFVLRAEGLVGEGWQSFAGLGHDGPIDPAGDGGGFAVDLCGDCPGRGGEMDEACSGLNHGAGADRDEEVAGLESVVRRGECGLRELLAEPYHAGTKDTGWVKGGWARELRERLGAGFKVPFGRGAPPHVERAVELDDVTATGALVEAVDVLRNEREGAGLVAVGCVELIA